MGADPVTGLAYSIIQEACPSSEEFITGMADNLIPLLVAAFSITVGFVAYKLIKRALNKA